MSHTKKRRSPFVRLALVLTVLALSALLAACAAPTGGSPTGAQPAAAQALAVTQAPAPTQAPPPTEAPAAPTEAAPEPTAALAEPTMAPAPTEMAAAPTEAPAAAEAAVSFSQDLMPVFEKSCIKCHGGEDGTKGDLDLRTYDAMMKGGKDGQVVAPGDHANSMLWKLVDNGKMPRRQPKLPQEQIDLIASWIDEGAQNN